MTTSNDTLARLAAVIESRRGGDPDKSYVARLFAKGTDAILKKIGEEATEVVMAAKDGDRKKIVAEWPTCGSTRWWRWPPSA
jgi:phosphoribosyl-ATP pyrophosphohydrolase